MVTKQRYEVVTWSTSEHRWTCMLTKKDEWSLTAEGNSEYLAMAAAVFRAFHIFLKNVV